MTRIGAQLVLTLIFGIVSTIVQDARAQNRSSYVGEARSGYSDSHHHHHPHPHHVIHTSHHGGGGGGSHFSSFFDIALTGLAFLSFGIFLLNLLMTALAGAASMNTMTPVLPTNTGTGIITNTADTGRSARGKRDLGGLDLHLERFVSLETLAAAVLKSIDAMVSEHECLEKVFCDGTKEAKVIGSGFQFMMPAYSLGASYIGKKIGFHNSFTDHLKAVAMGFGEANCQSQFPQC